MTTSTAQTNEQKESHGSKKQQLLKRLEKQLIYYFSTNNLAKDVYLQTIMNLNSGHVPVSILANFSNVIKIIGKNGTLQYFNNIENDSDDSDDKEEGKQTDNDSIQQTTAQGETTNSEKAIQSSNKTSISVIHEYTTQVYDLLCEAANQSNLLSVVSLNQYGNVVDEDSIDQQDQEDAARIRTILAIRPSSEFNGVVPEEYIVDKEEMGTSDYKESTRQPPTDSSSSNVDDGYKSNVIILRDVHSDATENDIRGLFEETHILSVNKDIGNCWFVALNSISQQDVIEVMQSLRIKTICGEAIKARLKTQSVTSSSMGESTYQPNPYYGRNPYYRGGARFKGGSGSYYSSSRGYHSNQIYVGDRVSYASKKYSRGAFDENYGVSYKKRYHRDGKSGNQSNTTEEGKVAKTQEPPPPVGEEHYPSLSGEVGDTSPTSVTISANPSSSFGYAAAVMKENPPPPMPVSTDTKPTATNVPASSKAVKNESNRISNLSAKTSTVTVSTDDASSDEKSSLSSKPESESFIGSGTTAAPATIWGGGKSFADILKK